MKRHPFLPLAAFGLFILWLLLNQTVSYGHILLGGAAALVGSWALSALRPQKVRIRRLGAIIRLSLRVLVDIVKSNIAVGRIILGPARQERRAGFVNIPLELRNPYALATLGCIITSTPGTLWVDFDATKGTLMIHVLDLIDESTWIRTIKGRYERPLLEIFE
ncbi:MAG: Na+/H+ antiporter subunit E [Rhizobiales bacterium]|nr:Na+/H+ antiporter subunit E [Hyphomicrobiales bacterium]